MVQEDVTPLALLLQRGQLWQRDGKLFQAIALYFRLLAYHPETREAGRAREYLLDLAQQFEFEGKVHQATHLYERLAAHQ